MRKRWQRFLELLKEQLRLLLTINPSDRRWQMPIAAALATGLPLFVGAWFDRLDYGLVSSLGGLVFLYLPATPLSHRMVTLMACAFGMLACYTLGLMSHFLPWSAATTGSACRAACSSSWPPSSACIRRWRCCRCR